MAAIIRQDLAEEAAAGFPLLKRFPNSEIASVPGYFTSIAPADREILLDALAAPFHDPMVARHRS